MANIRRGKPVIDCMNGVASVFNVGFRFVNQMVSTGKASHNRDASAVKAQVLHLNSPKETKPSLRWILRQLNQCRAFLLNGPTNERAKIMMQRSGMNLTALASKGYRAGFQIDVLQRDSCLRKTATLPHSYEPTFPHPTVRIQKLRARSTLPRPTKNSLNRLGGSVPPPATFSTCFRLFCFRAGPLAQAASKTECSTRASTPPNFG